MENSFNLRPGMLLGVASSATQVDGGDFNHTWNDWYNKGHIKDGSNPADAADHWERWREDVLLMHKMGIQTCRMSIEWSRRREYLMTRPFPTLRRRLCSS